MKPKLFLLKMPFKDGPDTSFFCAHCALIEGALAVNPHWAEQIDVHRIGFEKPRSQLIELLGENKQWLPVLIVDVNKYINDPVDITQYLFDEFGGAAPHP